MEKIFKDIKEHKSLNKDICEVIDVGRDGNCFYRSLSKYFTKDESYYNFFIKQIYSAALVNFEYLKEFFYTDQADTILVNNKIDGYVDKIKEDGFFAGIIELYLEVKILNINIAVYERNNTTEDFKQYAFFEPDSGTKEIIIINLENRAHYNIINIHNLNKDENFYTKNNNDIKKENFCKNKKQSKNASFHLKSNDEIKDITSFVSIGDNKYFYNDLYIYLKTLEKATYKEKNGISFIKWNLVKYPDSLINSNMNQNTKNKKKYNYRQKANNYTIENNKLYFTGHENKNNVK